MRFSFGNIEIDTESFQLFQDGQLRAVEPQVFDLLAYLIQNRDRIIGRQELFDKLWVGKVVSESTLSSCVKAARQAIGDDGRSQRYIATLNRRGYRFVGDINEPESDSTVTTPVNPDADLLKSTVINNSEQAGSICPFPIPPSKDPGRPTLAVLPFAHNHGDQSVAWIAEVLGDDISMQLARIPGFLVTSRNSMAHYRNREMSIQQIGKELGTDYIIEGSVWQMGQTLRVSVQLLETSTNHMLWADRYDVPADNIVSLQDEVVRKIVNCIEPELNRAELSAIRKRRQVDLGAWELYRQGHAILGLKGWSEESFHECAELLRQAIRRDPELAFAHAYLSLILAMGHLVGLINDENWREEAMTAVETAIALDSQDPDVLGYVGCALADMGDRQRGIGMLRRAVELDPSNAQALSALGVALLQTGDEDGIEYIYQGIRISPRDSRLGPWGALLARGLLSYNRIDEAIDIANAACRSDDKIFLPRIMLAIACWSGGDMSGAKAALDDARRLRPGLSIDDIRRFASERELEGLLSANLLGAP